MCGICLSKISKSNLGLTVCLDLEQMISNLTFEQENTIADEPVVDLLKFLTNKLDTAVVKARLPSGHNPLQQLVLIIADGRFHEKVLDKKTAFILSFFLFNCSLN